MLFRSDGGFIDSTAIGQASASVGKFTGLTASSLEVTGILTVDSGNMLLTGGTVSGSLTVNSLTGTTVDLNGGTIDGTVIGSTTPAAGNFSTVDIDAGTIDGTTIGGTSAATATFTDAYAQNRMGIGTTTPQLSLDIQATDAIQLPSGSEAQRPASPSAGMLRYSTQSGTFEGYNGTGWSGLGGVVDLDRDTLIKAESGSGTDEDSLYFQTQGIERARIDSTEIGGAHV